MLDPRVYRNGLIVVALAAVVLAFSLQNQPGGLPSTLAPQAFNGATVYNTMEEIRRTWPDRPPGSAADGQRGRPGLASMVAAAFDQDTQQFSVSRTWFTAQTVDGERTLENVIAVRPGTESRSIVIVAPRDGTGASGLASASATATLIELAGVLSGETLNHTVVLVSTSGSQGEAGAARLAAQLPGPVDAVIVLGDLASARLRQPIVVPWSAGSAVSPPVLRNTLASAIEQQTSLIAGGAGFADQLAHLAFDMTLSPQAPFVSRGIPAVTLSISGDRGPAAGAPIAGPGQVGGLGKAVLASISAIDNATPLAAPSAYLLLDGKVVPGWAVSLFVLALIIPVVMATIDGIARVRRHGHLIRHSLVLVLAAAVPFALAALIVVLAGLTGAIGAPPGPAPPGSVALGAGGLTVLALAALVALAAATAVAALARRSRASARPARRPAPVATVPDRGGRSTESAGDGPAASLLVVMCLVTLASWAANPFAALLLIPALHLWMWAIDSGVRLRAVARLALVALGLVPGAWLVVHFAGTLGYNPGQAAWTAVLLVAGQGVGPLAVLEWSVVLGCAAGASTIAVLVSRDSTEVVVPVTVRGPVTYAGPGSLGGTKSALRR